MVARKKRTIVYGMDALEYIEGIFSSLGKKFNFIFTVAVNQIIDNEGEVRDRYNVRVVFLDEGGQEIYITTYMTTSRLMEQYIELGGSSYVNAHTWAFDIRNRIIGQ